MALLEVENLSVSFATGDGDVPAVSGVSLQLDAGETLGLVGESGCGKSVTALAVLRLLDDNARVGPESVIRFRETDLLRLDESRLREIRGAGISIVFQDPMSSLNPVLPIGEQVTETVVAHEDVGWKAARSRAVEMLGRVGIPDPKSLYSAYPHELSGGMQQRAMIAMSLVCGPAILIADEPTTALDVTVQAQILDLLENLKQELNMGLLLITHDFGVVAEVADRVAVMYGGRIMESGPCNRIFQHPAHPYTQGLLAAVPRIGVRRGELQAIPGSVPDRGDWPAACRFHPRCPHVWDRCRESEPELLEAGPAHAARCWLMVDEAHG